MNFNPEFHRKFLCTDVKSKYYNPLHEEVISSICYPAFVKPGERAWILFEDGGKYPHRLHTSKVIGTRVSDILDDDGETVVSHRYIIETENSEYIFVTLKEEDT